MNIGIDIDDTLTETSGALVAYAQLFNCEINKDTFIPKELVAEINNSENIDVYMGWNKEQNAEFQIKYVNFLFEHVPFKPLAAEILKKLVGDGHKIFVISARDTETEYNRDAYKLTEKLFKKNKVNYFKLITDCEDKPQACIDNKIDLFIEDRYQICESLCAGGIRAFLMTSPHNINFDEPAGITRVHSWPDVYYRIKQLENKL